MTSEQETSNAALIEAAGNGDSIMAMMRNANEGQETVFDLTAELDAEGNETSAKRLVIERRQLQPEETPEPRLARSPKRSHTFLETEGFSAYLKKYGTEGKVVILADPNESRMVAVLNEEADKGYETVALEAQTDPMFQPWEELLEKRVSGIKDFADFLMQHRTSVANDAGRELSLLLRQVKAATDIQLHSGIGSGATNGLLVKSTIQAQKQTDEVDLPDYFDIEVPLYVGTDPVILRIDLLVDTVNGGTGIVAMVSCGDLERRRRDAFNQMLESVKVEGAIVTLGTADWGDWRLV